MVSVYVPATSANLGAGFDCLGIAVDLYLTVHAVPSTKHEFFYRGEGFVPNSPDNLVHQGYFAVYQRVKKECPSVRFEVHNPIPLARGLGSSSAALVAGAAIADYMLGSPLGREGIFQVVAAIEGHPDNVAPAIFGGFTVSAKHKDAFISAALEVPKSWQWLFGVPDFELLTSKARSVLPLHYSRDEVIFNTSRTALLTLAIANNRPDLLKVATQDCLHEPYRYPLIANIDATKAKLWQAGAAGFYLSGAGPTVAVIVTSPEASIACQKVLEGFVGTGCVLLPKISEGYQLEISET